MAQAFHPLPESKASQSVPQEHCQCLGGMGWYCQVKADFMNTFFDENGTLFMYQPYHNTEKYILTFGCKQKPIVFPPVMCLYYSLIYYILTTVSPPSTPPSSPDTQLPSPQIYSSSVFPPKRAGLPGRSTEHSVTSSNKTRHKPSCQSWMRKGSSRGKGPKSR